MIVSVTHDPDTQTLTVVTGSKTVIFAYQGNLPGGWESNPELYSGLLVNFLNNQIAVRTLKRTWNQDHDLKPNDPLPFTDSERLYYDSNSDEVVFVDCIVTGATWSPALNQFLIYIRISSFDNPKV